MKNNLLGFADIKGSISYFCRGTGIGIEDLRDIDTFNIRDKRRKIIGHIDSFDFENDIWYGRILKNSSIYKNMMDGKISSMEFVVKGSED